MSQDGLQDTAGITLFSKPSQKRRRKDISTASVANCLTQTHPASETDLDRKGAEQGGNTSHNEAQIAAEALHAAAERQEAASTSGREELVSFKSLGISEWLDR